ncbi:hypothetical protein B0H11DRAFT_2160655 [Mycena galericulata]|nr:hypothetical protein B0H11DRAFT_2160655 [Mycena galericulata]
MQEARSTRDRSHFTKQHLVSLPDAYPLPPLAPDSIRIVSRLISLTSNNFTYARLGHLLGWWDFGRISAWGYAAVLVSTHPGVPAGTQLYGYLLSPRRTHLWPIYNRYIAYPPTQLPAKTNRAWDALMRVLFETSDVTDRYAFAWAGDASVVDAIALLLAPSGKTALALAHQLRHAPPANAAPRRVVGVGSATSRAFTRGTCLFDDRLGLVEPNTKIVLVEFGARGDAALAWFRALQALSPTETRAIIVGSDPAAPGRSTLASFTVEPTSGVVQLSMDALRTGAEAWAAFKDTEGGAVEGVGVKWGEGMEAVGEGWEGLAGERMGRRWGWFSSCRFVFALWIWLFGA